MSEQKNDSNQQKQTNSSIQNQNSKSYYNTEHVQDYMRMKFYQFKAQNALMDNFQLLFLKKYDKLLTEEEKTIRKKCDYLIQTTSTVANFGSFFFILSNLSVTQEIRFNPIRDFKVLVGGVALMFALRGAGILYMWSQCENMYFRIYPKINLDEQVDFYAENINNNFKIFLYRYFF
ncbi:transmembrane protein, putative (macronuclear) [Tetrahymena thermophila SB210]|uniref:Transmembrane protein, putative n=1 Tax=Tetrahymena thermophila (strain SB210) TaxID=312017 RepID=I7MED6_TETTS|nr:transmembrane protein, putative [Tetrahymena thermophila SB210]EAR96133.1 transmembrane protein, putative [Tetrahymena thermophila SB210]|eukprot:XP_001016378.1 transmembrane protein, putative [Tetrahymena thermophila SB210]